MIYRALFTLLLSVITAHALLNTETLQLQAIGVTTEQFPDADEVLLNDITEVTYQPDGTSQTQTDTALKILTEKGKRNNRTLSLSFNISYGTNYFTHVERITPQGEIIPIDIASNSRLMVNPSQMSANIYNPNSKILQLSIPGLQIGDLLRYATHDQVTKTVVPNTWSDYQVFEADIPILKATYLVNAPAERPLQNLLLKDEIPGTLTHTETHTEDRIHYTWTIENVPQYFAEPSMPTPYTVTQRLLISTIETWEDLSRWYWNLCLPRMECTTPAMEAKTRELAAGKSTQEIIEALFTFVSQEIRYMGITTEEEAPGYEPHDVSITFENRYGVCRDKAALLAAMLRIAGVDAFPVIIMAGPKKDEEVPQPFFNHAVTAALDDNGDYVLMDPTDENTKDIFPAYLQNMSYLVARPEGETLKTSPIIPAAQNRVHITTQANLDAQGQLSAHTTIDFEGINDTIYRTHFSKLKPEERRQFFEGHLRSASASATLESITFHPPELRDTTQPLRVELHYQTNDLLTRNSDPRLLKLPHLGTSIGYANFLLRETGLTNRRFPLYTRITAGIQEIYQLDIDPALGTPRIPHIQSTQTDNLLWSRAYAHSNNTLSITNRFELHTVQFSPQEYAQLKTNLEQIEYESRKQILLQNAPSNTEQPTPTPPNPPQKTPAQPDLRILDHQETFTLTDTQNWNQKTYRKTKILTYAGQKEQAEIQLSYNPAWEHVIITNARVTLPDGTVKTVRAEETNLMDASWSASAPRYPAEKILVVNLPSVEIGSTIEYETHRTVSGKPCFALHRYFNGFDPIDAKKVTLHLPATLVYQQRSSGIELSETLNDQTRTLTWEAQDQPAVIIEEDLPAWHTFNPYIRLTTTDWKTYANQIHTHLQKTTQNQPNATQLAHQITHDLSTDRARIQALRNWVSKNIRHAGPSFTDLPLRFLTPADITLADRYGNHADQMILLHTMLHAIGISSEWILSDSSSLIPEANEPWQTLPSRNLFDFFLLKTMLNGQPLYLSGNSHYAELGTTRFDHHSILSIPTGEIETIELPDHLADLSQTEIRCTLKSNGDMIYLFKQIDQGSEYEDSHATYAEMTPELRRRYQQEILSSFAHNATARQELTTDYNHYPGIFSIEAEAPQYAILDDEFLYCDLPIFFDDLLVFRSTTRTHPLDHDYWHDEQIHIHVSLPPEYELIGFPSTFEWNGPQQCGQIKIDSLYHETTHTLTLTGTAAMRPAIIPAHQFNQLIEGERQLSHPDRYSLLLKKRARKPTHSQANET